MRDPAARPILRWWLAYSLFAAFLLLPGVDRSPFSGIPFSSQATILSGAALILAIFTAFFRPARPSSPLWSALLLVAIVGKLFLAPALVPAGWRAEYSTSKADNNGRLGPLERAYFQSGLVARPYRIDRAIDYEGVTFGLSFINDLVQSLSTLPRDVTQPLLVHWTGYLALDRAEDLTIPVTANGRIIISFDGKELFRATNPQRASISVRLTPGAHHIAVIYSKPPATKPGAHVLLATRITPAPADSAMIRRSRRAAAGIVSLGVLALLALAGAFVGAYRPVSRLVGETIWLQPDRLAAILFAAIAIIAGVRISVPARHATIQLGAGDDPLVYEADSRLIARNGLQMRHDDGTATPYYFYPLYSYILAGAHAAFGDDPSTIVLFNLLCIAAVGPLMWGLLRNRLPRGSIVVVLAVTGLFAKMYLYAYAGTAFTDNLYVPIVLAVILANVAALTRRSIPLLFLTGALTALGAATRPSLLIHVPCVFLLLLLYRDFGSLARRSAAVAGFIGGFIVAVSPFTLRNWLVSGHFHLLVTNYITFPMYLLGPDDAATPFRAHGQRPGFLDSVAQFMHIFASRPLHFGWLETCKVLYTLGLTRFGPYGAEMPDFLFVYPLFFALALWRRRVDKPVAAAILTLSASHMAAILAASPYTYGYKTILPFHLAMIAGAAFLLKFSPRPAGAATPAACATHKPSVSVILTAHDEIPGAGEAFRNASLVDEVLTISANAGDAHALREALRATKGDCIVFCDAVGGYDPADVQKLLTYAANFEIVYGSRVNRIPLWLRSESEPSLFRGWIVAKYVELLYNTPTLTDACCGLRLMWREVAETVCADAVAHGGGKYTDLEMMISTLRLNYRFVQVPVSYHPTAPGAGSPFDAPSIGAGMIALVTRRWLRAAFRRDAPRERTA